MRLSDKLSLLLALAGTRVVAQDGPETGVRMPRLARHSHGTSYTD